MVGNWGVRAGMVGNWGVRAGKMRENGNDSDSWGEKEEIQLWIEKGLNKPREWQRKDMDLQHVGLTDSWS